jgi:hypothetical protein
MYITPFIGAFVKFRKLIISFLTPFCLSDCYACLSVCPDGTSRLQRNMIFEHYQKSVENVQVSLNSEKVTGNFKIVWPCIVTHSLWIKPTEALNSNFIGITTLHVSGRFSAHHQEFLVLHRHWYILCRFDDRLLPRAGLNSLLLVQIYQCRCKTKNS